MKLFRVILTVLVVVVLTAGTVLEKYNPAIRIYDMWWFAVILALLALAAVVAIVQGHMWRRLDLLLIHASVPVILLGGALTSWTGHHGSMTLLPNVPSSTVTDDWQLPFSITLESFSVVPYPGTHTPMDFVSRVNIEGQSYDISMNNILRYRGYRFYQEDYGDDGSSTLSVAHDPWGIGITYCGYAILLMGLLWMLLNPTGRFRRLLKSAALVALLLMPVAASAADRQLPPTLPRDAANRMGDMYVLYKGRVCPLETMAKDFTVKLSGSATYHGLSAEQVLSGYLFYFDRWADEPIIKVKGGEWQNGTGIEGNRVSMRQLLFLDTMRATPSSEKNLRAAVEKYNVVKGLLAGHTLKLFPVADTTGSIGWYAQNDPLPENVAEDEYIFIRRWQSYCQEFVVTNNMAELERVFDKTTAYQQQRTDSLPSTFRTSAEHLLNAITAGRWLAMFAVTFSLIAFALSLVRRRGAMRWLDTVISVYAALLTFFLITILVLRWIVGGHAPMAGGYDSMNLMAIVLGIIAFVASRSRNYEARGGAPAAALAMGFCLLVAMMSGANPPVTNLMPVLNSPLLTVHVAVIMCSYALFFFVMILGLTGLITGRNYLRRQITILLYPAVSLLAAGIIVGAIWANISWGNYWSWDPKEVWALITFIVYAFALHTSVLRSNRAFFLYCTLAFLSVVITYFGVNFILGGIHAYN